MHLSDESVMLAWLPRGRKHTALIHGPRLVRRTSRLIDDLVYCKVFAPVSYPQSYNQIARVSDTPRQLVLPLATIAAVGERDRRR